MMLEYLSQEANKTLTENGGAAYASTGSDCLDLFASVGALRREDEDEIVKRFTRAFAENADAAVKLLFFARDVRGGLGERRVFRIGLRWLAENKPETVRKNLAFTSEYGRFDDLLALIGTPCENEMLLFLKRQFDADMTALKEGGAVSLLAKWLPSANASSGLTVKYAKKTAKAFGLSERDYRKALTALRREIRIIENNLRERDYTFDYEKQPSRALYKYRSAFMRNDSERYGAFISRVSSGRAVLNARNVAPYELVEPYVSAFSEGTPFLQTEEERAVLNATWGALPDYAGGENALAVIDTSGSMYWSGKPLAAAVALSLGLYFAERNTGAFRNCFIEFSDQPQLIRIKGETFADRLRYLMTFNKIGSTNLEAVFGLILSAAVKNRVPQAELPARLIIISDMEFNACRGDASQTVFEKAREKFAAAGYTLPEVVFWNAASRHGSQPVTMDETGVKLVSGVTPRLFEMLAKGSPDPYAFMMEVLMSERYAKIAA